MAKPLALVKMIRLHNGPKRTRLYLFAFVLLVGLQSLGFCSDLQREKRLAEQISDGIIDGEVVYLPADKHQFLAIHTQADTKPTKDAVIIVHGRGLHPDENFIANPMRTGLAEKGWDTLSIQMPVLTLTAGFADYAQILSEGAPRFEQAIKFLRQKGYSKVHLVAHSCGTQMTMSWIDNGGGEGISSLTLVSMGTENYSEHFGHAPPLDKLKIPVLDIYGSQDFIAPKAEKRYQLIEKAGNSKSQQIMVHGADHMFTRHQSPLLHLVADWLTKVAVVQ